MFVGDEVLLDVGFAAARARLTDVARGGLLQSASEDAYAFGLAGLRSASEDAYAFGLAGLPTDGEPSVPGLARVQVREMAARGGAAGLAIRWEIADPGTGLFPVLDADITLSPAGTRATMLALAGAYRPLLAPDTAAERQFLRRVGAATIRNFLGRVAAGITGQPGPAPLPRTPEVS